MRGALLGCQTLGKILLWERGWRVGKSVFYSRVAFLNETARFWCRGSSHAASNASMGPRGLGQEPPVLVPGQRLAAGRGSARCWPGAGAGSSDR